MTTRRPAPAEIHHDILHVKGDHPEAAAARVMAKVDEWIFHTLHRYGLIARPDPRVLLEMSPAALDSMRSRVCLNYDEGGPAWILEIDGKLASRFVLTLHRAETPS